MYENLMTVNMGLSRRSHGPAQQIPRSSKVLKELGNGEQFLPKGMKPSVSPEKDNVSQGEPCADGRRIKSSADLCTLCLFILLGLVRDQRG